MLKPTILFFSFCLLCPKSNASSIWSKWDSLTLRLCELKPRDQSNIFSFESAFAALMSTTESQLTPNWSVPITLYRATRRPLPHLESLNNVNLGNLLGELNYLKAAKKRLGEDNSFYIKAIKVRLNMDKLSDYFHCAWGRCEFRLPCNMGPCTTPLETIHESYARVGIKMGTRRVQLSRCGRSYVCPEDICLTHMESEKMFKACVNTEEGAMGCYYGFTKEGEGLSYQILAQSESIKIDWDSDIEQQLMLIEKNIKY